MILGVENYESTHKITYIYEKKIGVQKNDQKCPDPNYIQSQLPVTIITKRMKFTIIRNNNWADVHIWIENTKKTTSCEKMMKAKGIYQTLSCIYKSKSSRK